MNEYITLGIIIGVVVILIVRIRYEITKSYMFKYLASLYDHRPKEYWFNLLDRPGSSHQDIKLLLMNWYMSIDKMVIDASNCDIKLGGGNRKRLERMSMLKFQFPLTLAVYNYIYETLRLDVGKNLPNDNRTNVSTMSAIRLTNIIRVLDLLLYGYTVNTLDGVVLRNLYNASPTVLRYIDERTIDTHRKYTGEVREDDGIAIEVLRATRNMYNASLEIQDKIEASNRNRLKIAIETKLPKWVEGHVTDEERAFVKKMNAEMLSKLQDNSMELDLDGDVRGYGSTVPLASIRPIQNTKSCSTTTQAMIDQSLSETGRVIEKIKETNHHHDEAKNIEEAMWQTCMEVKLQKGEKVHNHQVRPVYTGTSTIETISQTFSKRPVEENPLERKPLVEINGTGLLDMNPRLGIHRKKHEPCDWDNNKKYIQLDGTLRSGVKQHQEEEPKEPRLTIQHMEAEARKFDAEQWTIYTEMKRLEDEQREALGKFSPRGVHPCLGDEDRQNYKRIEHNQDDNGNPLPDDDRIKPNHEGSGVIDLLPIETVMAFRDHLNNTIADEELKRTELTIDQKEISRHAYRHVKDKPGNQGDSGKRKNS